MKGWNLKEGEVQDIISIKVAISSFFLEKGKMLNLYKLSLMKALIEVAKDSKILEEEIFYRLVIKFSEIYLKYKKQLYINTTIFNGKSSESELDKIILELDILEKENFEIIDDELKVSYILKSKELMKKNVIGALYVSLKNIPYTFDKKNENIYLNEKFKIFIIKNEEIINKLIKYRMIEFLKKSEKDKKILKKNLCEIGIENIEIDYYKIISQQLEKLEEVNICTQNKNLK